MSLVSDHRRQILVEWKVVLLVRLADETVPAIQLNPFQLEVSGGTSAREVVPTVHEQHPADIQKECRNRQRSLQLILRWNLFGKA
ncbi:MAG: hypothetical protein HIU93_11155 [Acidobacteria bacterium]|nr:hypothetical protein [Acidobacteriota bacterium]